MIIDLIAGARPNFMKIAPLLEALRLKANEGVSISFRLIHTGQHYDRNMSESFFEQLGIPTPDFNLGAGGGTQAEQTAKIMVEYEKVLQTKRIDLCLVVGDVTSTMACSIVAKKLNIQVAHVEAGIRSGDLTMPEEINRIVTDSITDYFFVTTEIAQRNLLKLGVNPDRIYFVGNTMIDTLLKQRPYFKKPAVWQTANLIDKGYFVLTLHRPANVDDELKFTSLLKEIIESAGKLPIIFPVHPRTKRMLDGLSMSFPNFIVIEPLGYLEFNYLVERAQAVITDSGGITEETTVMGVPCLTLRDTTERPETITVGTNELVGTKIDRIKPYIKKVIEGRWKKGSIPDLWDGQAAKRIVDILIKELN
ncbi:MAG TPA: UDP-N-acetylglucosamine 2-epimerase (non-hydrolyzing) [Ohtaekwangia sp.]|nr:UDP-N-acetylglucosamine 2-epimerase (non-hydrolyzing) [Ohtaekwangia sp.]